MKSQYKQAGLAFVKGVLVIDTQYSSFSDRHYNVEIEIINDSIYVIGDRPEVGLSLKKGDFNVDDITESSTHYYKPWPWSKPRLRSNVIVEYKKRRSVSYKSNSWVIK